MEIQGHPINTAVSPFKSIATVTQTILPYAHDCFILVSDRTYLQLVSSYRIYSNTRIEASLEAISKNLRKSIERKEMYFWSTQQSHYYPVDNLISVNIDRNTLTISVNGFNYLVYLDSICPYSAFNQVVPYKLISFDEFAQKLNRGEIINSKVDPAHLKYFGLSGDPNTIVTVFDKYGNVYLVRGMLRPNNMFHPPI